MQKTESTSVSIELANEVASKIGSLRAAFSRQQVPGQIDLSPFSVFAEWTYNFAEAAKIDLKLKSLEAEVEQFQLEQQRAELKVARFDNMFRDADNLHFNSFFDQCEGGLDQRLQVVDQISKYDREQAENFQRKYNKFESNYFNEYFKIAQESNNNMYQ